MRPHGPEDREPAGKDTHFLRHYGAREVKNGTKWDNRHVFSENYGCLRAISAKK